MSLSDFTAISRDAQFVPGAPLVLHPIPWFRIVAVIALLISLIPEFKQEIGDEARRPGPALVAPFSHSGGMFLLAEQGGGRLPPQPSPGGVLPGLLWDRVLILMLLHAATAVVCFVLLTTLTREPAAEVTRES